MPILSICIPTFNRSKYLEQLISSIVSQADPNEVEIVISDNASTDDTENMVHDMQKIYENILYYRFTKNEGADVNYMSAVNLSNGDYCWLMGSDDFLPEGAIKEILYQVSVEDVYLIDRVEANINLEPISRERWLQSSSDSCVFDFSRPHVAGEYFSRCRRLGGLFSYLSSIIIKKSAWLKYPCDPKYFGTLYSHAYVVLSILMSGGVIKYIPKSLVYSRAGNDSFLTNWVSRGLIDLRGYNLLGQDLISSPVDREIFWGVMHNELGVINLIKSLGASGWKNWAEFKEISSKVYKLPKYKFRIAEIMYPLARIAYLLKVYFKKFK